MTENNNQGKTPDKTEEFTRSITMKAIRKRVKTKPGVVTVVVGGKQISAKKVVVRSAEVEAKTRVWINNERDQSLLKPASIADILTSIKESGIDKEAIAREVGDVYEIADGSRRRYAAIIASQNYPMLVADLTDQQMEVASKTGNDYLATSEYEKGLTHKKELLTMTISQVADKNRVHRNIITRRVLTASLPKELVCCFPTVNDLSARMGAEINGLIFKGQDILKPKAKKTIEALVAKSKTGTLVPEEILAFIKDRLKAKTPKPITRDITPNAKLIYCSTDKKATIMLSKVSQELLHKITTLITEESKIDDDQE